MDYVYINIDMGNTVNTLMISNKMKRIYYTEVDLKTDDKLFRFL